MQVQIYIGTEDGSKVDPGRGLISSRAGIVALNRIRFEGRADESGSAEGLRARRGIP